jgi:hypothetical protein
MPQPFRYVKGQRVTLIGVISEDRDAGHPVLDIGGERVSITRQSLDRADVREDKDRLPTVEEIDLKRLREAQDAKAVAQAHREAAAELARQVEGRQLLDAAADPRG